MSRYIDIGKLSEEHKEIFKTYPYVSAIIQAYPSADVEPVRHGRYKSYENSYGCRYICSVCGCDFKAPMYGALNYCPHCGARMDGESDE